MADVLVAGAGLMGTSLALALRESHDVVLADTSVDTVRRAVQRGAGRAWDEREPVELVVVCVPPRRTARVLVDLALRDAGEAYTHVASVQAPVQHEIESELAGSSGLSSICGGHPLAGRERSGPDAATARLFTGRTWAVCPSPATSAGARAAVEELARAVGAYPVVLDAAAHDRGVALVSHLPQLAASALAARLQDGPDLIGQLAGPGLQDSTRVAASDAALWTDILSLNAGNLAGLVRALSEDLAASATALDALAAAAADLGPGVPSVDPAAEPEVAAVLTDLLRRGAAGRERVPIKRGERDADFVVVAVSVVDAPGQLARLLTAAGDGGVNVEDVRVEHAPDDPRGVIELLVRPAARSDAVQVLTAAGWDVLGVPG